MSRILFAWELGANLGHLTRDLPVASQLRAAGHEVFFAVRDTRIAAEVLGPARIGYTQAPIITGQVWLAASPVNYAELLVAEGWHDRRALLGHLGAWRALIALGRFDAVIADHAPGALVAARIAGCTSIPLGSGFEIPPDSAPMPAIRPWEPAAPERLLAAERAMLSDINAAVSALGGAPYARLGEIFGPAPILTTWGELDHYGERPAGLYIGAIHGLESAPLVGWPRGDGPRVVVYLRPRHPAIGAVLDALAACGARAVCVIPGVGVALKARSRVGIAVYDHPVALAPLLAEADVMVGYGSNGTLAKAMQQGVPLLMLPMNVEQYLGARRVQALEAGILLEGAPDKERIGAALAALCEDPSFKSAACAFAVRHAETDTKQAAAAAARYIGAAIEAAERQADGKLRNEPISATVSKSRRCWDGD